MVISNVEIILGITGLSFAFIVVYFAFKLENKNNNKYNKKRFKNARK